MLTVHAREILAIAAICFSISIIVGFLAMVISAACKKRKGQHEAASGRHAPPTPTKVVLMEEVVVEQVQARPLLCRYLKADGWQDATCGVCLAKLADGDALRVLPPCMHYFHAVCVGDWIRLHATCPFCRAPVAATHPA